MSERGKFVPAEVGEAEAISKQARKQVERRIRGVQDFSDYILAMEQADFFSQENLQKQTGREMAEVIASDQYIRYLMTKFKRCGWKWGVDWDTPFVVLTAEDDKVKARYKSFMITVLAKKLLTEGREILRSGRLNGVDKKKLKLDPQMKEKMRGNMLLALRQRLPIIKEILAMDILSEEQWREDKEIMTTVKEEFWKGVKQVDTWRIKEILALPFLDEDERWQLAGSERVQRRLSNGLGRVISEGETERARQVLSLGILDKWKLRKESGVLGKVKQGLIKMISEVKIDEAQEILALSFLSEQERFWLRTDRRVRQKLGEVFKQRVDFKLKHGVSKAGVIEEKFLALGILSREEMEEEVNKLIRVDKK
jgi:hypothetical protein